MTASPGATYQNDILGNRTWKNNNQSRVQRYVWDEYWAVTVGGITPIFERMINSAFGIDTVLSISLGYTYLLSSLLQEVANE